MTARPLPAISIRRSGRLTWPPALTIQCNCGWLLSLRYRLGRKRLTHNHLWDEANLHVASEHPEVTQAAAR